MIYTTEDKIAFLRDVLDATEDRYKYYEIIEQLLRAILIQNGGEIKISPEAGEESLKNKRGFEIGGGAIRFSQLTP